MNRCREAKRTALAVALIRVRTAQALDDLAEMFLRLMQKMHHKAKEALDAYRREHQEQTDTLISLLSELVGGWQHRETAEEQLKTISTLIGRCNSLRTSGTLLKNIAFFSSDYGSYAILVMCSSLAEQAEYWVTLNCYTSYPRHCVTDCDAGLRGTLPVLPDAPLV